MTHAWPGNVRELQNVADRFVLGLTGDSLLSSGGTPAAGGTLAEQLAYFERMLIEDMLQRNNGNVADASEALGMPKKTLYHKLRNLRIPRAATRRPMAANDANEDTHSSMDRIDITEHGRVTGHLIRGVTHAQKTFRPSDWPERLAGVITLFVGERRPGYPCALSRLAMPVVDGNVKCLFVSDELRTVCADAFDFAMQFATDNDLPVVLQTAPALAVLTRAAVAARFPRFPNMRCAGAQVAARLYPAFRASRSIVR